MLPSDNFLRNLPKCLVPVERLRLETLVFAHDLMEIALNRMAAVGFGFSENSGNNGERLAMFGDAWTIVDQVHVARQILLSLTGDDRKRDTQDFLDDFAAAHVLRNKMDHLNQNIPNRVKTNGCTNALFGMLTFFRPHADQWEQGINTGEIKGDLFIITAGAIPSEAFGTVMFHDLDIHLPICSFKLEAFDTYLLLERAVLNLGALLKRMSADIRGAVETKLLKETGTENDQFEKAMESAGGHITIRMEFGLRMNPQLVQRGVEGVSDADSGENVASKPNLSEGTR